MRDMDVKILDAVSDMVDEAEPVTENLVGAGLRSSPETNTLEPTETVKRRTKK